ncbi:ATP-binding protein [Azospirillum sp. BE72]|uniref:sensor histidine kinase n=1 Tax=Azospirillum sp. BE72 TaxID=2817776 RepID=UPI002857C2CF|nr:ATP-binding protein [Azospirillum sp. BE72]MDR6773642.1 signal transduction histidine kinase [Azospirillum sp. BE72]
MSQHIAGLPASGPHLPMRLRAWLKGRGPLLLLYYGLAVLLGLGLVMATPPTPDGALPIMEARFTAVAGDHSVDSPPPEAMPPGVATVPLPHRCKAVPDPVGCSGLFRLTFRYAPNEDGPWSVYVPILSGRITLWVNGALLADSQTTQSDVVVNQAMPLIQRVPSQLLKDGENRIDIRMDAWSQSGGFLDTVLVGPDRLLRAAYSEREWMTVTLPRLLVAWQAALCLSLLIVWIGHRDEPIHLVMSLILGLGVLQGLPMFSTGPSGLEWLFRVVNFAGQWQGALLPFVMCRLVGRELAVPIRLLLVVPAVIAIAFLITALDPPRLQPWFALLWLVAVIPWAIAMLGWSAGILISAAVRRSHAPAQIVLGGLIVIILMAAHDILSMTGVLDLRVPSMTRYMAPLLMTVISATLMWRFAKALGEVSRFNDVLRREVATAEAELRASFAREQAQTRAAALESERLRLTRDLHDGLAGQLVSIVAQCELPQHDYRRIGAAARQALDDLRLVVASLDDVGNDLGMMLAQFYDRIGPQLQAQGMELDWQMAPLPDIEGLRSEHALTLFRILQEAVTNAVRHSGCRRVAIVMAPSPACDHEGHPKGKGRFAVRIVVRDEGRGIPGGIPGGIRGGIAAARPGKGLNNMRTRAVSLGAELTLLSGPDGTRVIIDLPFRLPGLQDIQ